MSHGSRELFSGSPWLYMIVPTNSFEIFKPVKRATCCKLVKN